MAVKLSFADSLLLPCPLFSEKASSSEGNKAASTSNESDECIIGSILF